jgi:hypothetical protein
MHCPRSKAHRAGRMSLNPQPYILWWRINIQCFSPTGVYIEKYSVSALLLSVTYAELPSDRRQPAGLGDAVQTNRISVRTTPIERSGAPSSSAIRIGSWGTSSEARRVDGSYGIRLITLRRQWKRCEGLRPGCQILFRDGHSSRGFRITRDADR